MKNIFFLKPSEGEISEIRGLQDFIDLLKKSDSVKRIKILARLNLADIDSVYELRDILSILNIQEQEQFINLFDEDFAIRMIIFFADAAEKNEYFNYFEGTLFTKLKKLISANNIGHLVNCTKNRDLEFVKNLLNELPEDIQKNIVAQLDDLEGKLRTLLFKHHKKSDKLSFARWPGDIYEKFWNNIEDTHAERCNDIIKAINIALTMFPLLQESQRKSYLEILYSSMKEILLTPFYLKYLLSNLPKDSQPLLMTLMMKWTLTPRQMVVLSEHPNSHYAFLAFLFETDKTSENLKLIKASIALNYQSPEGALALILMSDLENIPNDLLLCFKNYSKRSETDQKVSAYLLNVMNVLKDNDDLPPTIELDSAERTSALNRMVTHLKTFKAYDISKVVEKISNMSPKEVQTTKSSMFQKDSDKTYRKIIENSNFSQESIFEIQDHIYKLQKEINSSWPFPNKDRKALKIIGLKVLLLRSTQMDGAKALEQTEKQFPDIRKGHISSRTSLLLNKIQKEQETPSSLKMSNQ